MFPRSGPPQKLRCPWGRVRPPQGSAGGRPAEQGRPMHRQAGGAEARRRLDKTHRRREPDSVGAFYFKVAGCWVVGFPFPLSTLLKEARDQTFLAHPGGSAVALATPGCLPVAMGSSGRCARTATPAGPRPVCGVVWTAHQRDRKREIRSGSLAGRNRTQKELGKEGEAFLFSLDGGEEGGCTQSSDCRAQRCLHFCPFRSQQHE